jgi:hypothetical protein
MARDEDDDRPLRLPDFSDPPPQLQALHDIETAVDRVTDGLIRVEERIADVEAAIDRGATDRVEEVADKFHKTIASLREDIQTGNELLSNIRHHLSQMNIVSIWPLVTVIFLGLILWQVWNKPFLEIPFLRTVFGI